MSNDEIELDEELFEDNEGLEDNQENEETIELDVDENDEEETEEEEVEENDESETDEEIDYKALYEAEQEKKNKLQKALNAERQSKKMKTKETDVTENSTYKELVASGVDKAIAKTIAQNSNNNNSEIADLRFELQLTKVSKKSGFEDIEEYADEIRPFVDKGLTVEQAYYVATGEKQRTNTKAEIARQVEAKMKNQKLKSKVQKVDTNGSASVSNSKKPSSMDITMAKAFGMSIEEYEALKGIDNIEAYQKFKNKKK